MNNENLRSSLSYEIGQIINLHCYNSVLHIFCLRKTNYGLLTFDHKLLKILLRLL